MKLSFNQKRVLGALLVGLTFLSLANFQFDWRLFGGFDREVMIGAFVAMLVFVFRFGPTPREVADRKNRRKQHDD